MTNWLTGLLGWVDARLPVTRAWDTHMAKYYAPKNFNFWYFFGVLSILVLVNQLLTGIWLTMSYTPTAEGAFASVEYIMRDVDFGWIIRYMHSTGASAFFLVVYLHMFRGLMYGSYKAPRELVWIFGMTIYVALMAEAFMGYVLPWGQMSYWGAQVIVSLFGAIPVVGDDLVQWIRGDYLISGITLNRFFALHVVALPIVLLALVVLHILALHEVGSNNPDGVEIKKTKDENGIPLDGVAFHPFYTVHDLVGVTVFLFAFCFVIFFMPEMGGFFLEYANFEEANNLKTPPHIAPVWYFTPFYAILRAVTFDIGPLSSKFLGLIAMGAAIAILFVLPWLDKSPVKSMRYKGNFSRVALMVFAASFVILGYLGVKAPTEGRTILAQVCTVIYFAYFIGMPFWTKREKCLPEPTRTQAKGLGAGMVWGGLLLFVALTVIPIKAVGAETAYACGAIECDVMVPDLENKESLQRGAMLFTNYCMGCHAASFSRFGRVADDLGIPHDVMMDNMVFGDRRIGELMTIPMEPAKSKAWFGATPPDLTLVARARNPEWLYTYLRNFYKDDTRPTGVNNRVFDKVAMPHAMLELQGLAECAPGPHFENGRPVRDPVTGAVIADDPCGSLKVGENKGSMNAEEFDQAIYDLVNFLEYIAEPYALDRERIGIYVLLFLLVLFVFTYLLNREYWKDIH
ncbi:cytochrome b N-terminal domain-containing protein [Simiduia curdlanivorans]|uniref:Cytochrome b n=1 Tax=Simiduia curdlanivorans TaxID=1492769 RepID=A0ABV8V6S7_9GAMM|nr:cytochrome b N-terminal domain-containing protein [Simiduia curdlanivorans]MDN3638938.1 cytochrome b N-terminal domain-containing protein [Simiduia curdlanivorans]